MSAKERLLLWTQQATEGYAGVRCENFTTCWRDGKLFNAIIHKYRYGICHFPFYNCETCIEAMCYIAEN
jgi:hypothetical protein